MMRTNFLTSRSAARVFSWVLAFALVFSLATAPAASAESDVYSAEIVLSMDGMDLSGKITLDANQLLLGVIAGIASEGQTLMDAAAYLSPQALAFDSLLIGGAYGIDLGTLAQNLPKSIFAPDSGSAYALDQETYSTIMGLLTVEPSENNTTSSSNVTINSSSMEEAVNVLMEAYAGVPEAIMALVTTELSNGSVVIDSSPIQVSQIRCTMDGESSIAAIYALLAPLQENPQAQNALAFLIDETGAAAQNGFDATGQEVVEMILTELPGELENARAELAEENFTVSCVICLTPETQMPVKAALEFKDNAESIAINLLAKESYDFFRLEVVEDGSVEAAMEFEIEENTVNTLAFKFSVMEGMDEASLRFQLNKAGKAFLLTATADGESHSLSGFYNITDTLFTVTVDKLDGQDIGSITLNLRSDDSILLPSFTEVTQLSEGDFTELVETITQTAEALSESFG